MKSLFTKSIFCLIILLTTISENFAASIFEEPSQQELVLLVRNTLNPHQYYLSSEYAEFLRKKDTTLSEEESYKKAKLEVPAITTFPYHSNCIFFEYNPEINEKNIPHPYEGILVSPGFVYAHNSTFRIALHREDIGKDEVDYKASSMLLSRYLHHLKQAEEMKKDLLPEETILFHPITGTPFKVNRNGLAETVSIPGHKFPARWKIQHFFYSPSVPIHLSLLDKIAKKKIPCPPRRSYHTSARKDQRRTYHTEIDYEKVLLVHWAPTDIIIHGLKSPSQTLVTNSSQKINPNFPDFCDHIAFKYFLGIKPAALPYRLVGFFCGFKKYFCI